MSTRDVNAPFDYQVIYAPPTPFPHGVALKVAVEASDLARPPHTMPVEVYYLGIISATPTPTPEPIYIHAAGYLDTVLSAAQGGDLKVFAYVSRLVREVEVLYQGIPAGVFLHNDGGGVYTFSVGTQPGLPQGRVLLELEGRTAVLDTRLWPYLDVW